MRTAKLGLTEDEETSLITYADAIGSTGRKGSAWWRTLEAKGDLPGLVADWRVTQAPPARAAPPPGPIPKLNDPGCPVCHGLGCEDGDGFAVRCQPADQNRKAAP